MKHFNNNVNDDTSITGYEDKNPCSVCNDNTCKRHKLLPHSTKIEVPKDFDRALEEVIVIILHCVLVNIINNHYVGNKNDYLTLDLIILYSHISNTCKNVLPCCSF